MNHPERPSAIALCYEDRDEWRENSTISLAQEACRWLAPHQDVDLAAALIESSGIATLRLPLGGNRREYYDLLKSMPGLMLWNITDGLTVFCGSLIPSFAKILRIPSFGSPTYVQGLCQHKHHWRAILLGQAITCAPGCVIRDGSQQERAALSALTPPLFVKTATYGNNAGFSLIEPLAATADEAYTQAKRLVEGGLGPVLIEEFASGAEYSVWCFEGTTWEFVVYRKEYTADYHLTEMKDNGTGTTSAFSLGKVEAPEIVDLCRKIIDVIGIRDYVRIDIRINKNGVPIPIDLNTGAFLAGSSFRAACNELRTSAEAMLGDLIRASWQRQVASQ